MVAAVIAGQAVDIKPVADHISNMGWNVKIGVVGEPYGKDLSRWFWLIVNLAVGSFLLCLRNACWPGVGGYGVSGLHPGKKTPWFPTNLISYASEYIIM